MTIWRQKKNTKPQAPQRSSAKSWFFLPTTSSQLGLTPAGVLGRSNLLYLFYLSSSFFVKRTRCSRLSHISFYCLSFLLLSFTVFWFIRCTFFFSLSFLYFSSPPPLSSCLSFLPFFPVRRPTSLTSPLFPHTVLALSLFLSSSFPSYPLPCYTFSCTNPLKIVFKTVD